MVAVGLYPYAHQGSGQAPNTNVSAYATNKLAQPQCCVVCIQGPAVGTTSGVKHTSNFEPFSQRQEAATSHLFVGRWCAMYVLLPWLVRETGTGDPR